MSWQRRLAPLPGPGELASERGGLLVDLLVLDEARICSSRNPQEPQELTGTAGTHRNSRDQQEDTDITGAHRNSEGLQESTGTHRNPQEPAGARRDHTGTTGTAGAHRA